MASGFTKYTHFCKGVQMETRLTNHQEPDKPCAVCVAKNKSQKKPKKGCCTQEQELVQLKDKVLKNKSLQSDFKFWGNAIPNRTLGAVFDVAFTGTTDTVAPIFPAPPIPGNPLYILHCVYRI